MAMTVYVRMQTLFSPLGDELKLFFSIVAKKKKFNKSQSVFLMFCYLSILLWYSGYC